jgi:hypothetical protein
MNSTKGIEGARIVALPREDGFFQFYVNPINLGFLRINETSL